MRESRSEPDGESVVAEETVMEVEGPPSSQRHE